MITVEVRGTKDHTTICDSRDLTIKIPFGWQNTHGSCDHPDTLYWDFTQSAFTPRRTQDPVQITIQPVRRYGTHRVGWRKYRRLRLPSGYTQEYSSWASPDALVLNDAGKFVPVAECVTRRGRRGRYMGSHSLIAVPYPR